MMFKLRYWFVVLAVSVTAACSSSSDKGTGSSGSSGSSGSTTGDVPAVGQMTTVSITADSGGDVALGAAKLSIPAGALSADTDITMQTETPSSDLPELTTVKGPVYEFGPDGTTFGTAAPLALPLPSQPASGETAVVSWLDATTNTWQDLDTTVSGDSVTAAVPHFTFFVIRFKGTTGAVDCSFTACGGSLVGKWTINAGCIDDPNSDAVSGCPTATIDAQTDLSGSIDFGADGTFNVDLTQSGSISATIPTSCLNGETCDSWASSNKATCTTASAGCDCTGTIDTKHSTDGGTYATSGNSFDTTSTGDTSPSSLHEYCVSGNTLKVKIVDGTKSTILIGSK
jgi:hypothetical protein